jgi:acyl-coenzyme A thioesterase PaaI-like protein
MNVWPPFAAAGIHVTHIGADWRSAEVVLRSYPWARNYVGTAFGGSLYAMTDPFWMILVLRSLGPEYVVWDRVGEIDYVAPGRGSVRARFDLSEADLDEIELAVAAEGKVLRWFDTEVTGADGTVVARVRKQVYVRRKDDGRPHGRQ